MAKFSALIIRLIVFQINLVGCTCVEIFYMDILDIMSDIYTRRSIPPRATSVAFDHYFETGFLTVKYPLQGRNV